MSIILAGDRSGTGKTTLTLALLAALKKREHIAREHKSRNRTGKSFSVQSFKVGPDYIDPMFHSAVTGRPCYNLDPVLTSERYVQQSFEKHTLGADYAVVEGVMGLFDGATGTDDTASTAHIARLLDLPVVLAVDCSRMARSLAALVQGYRNFDSRVQIAGVVLNRVGSDRHLQLLSDAIAAIGVPIFGVFHREKDIELPSRHLGLVPTGEVDEFTQITERLADIGERCFDWNKLEPLLKTDNETRVCEPEVVPVSGNEKKAVRIAIARDAAFNFYYPDNFEALEAQGAELIFWSPMIDKQLPEADGLYFGGGFPEVFAAQLSANKVVRERVRCAIAAGTPTYAECGGLMYLSKTLIDFNNQALPMVGSIPQTIKMGGRLALGYRSATALGNGPLLENQQTVTGHEFHKSTIVESITQPVTKPAYTTRRYWGAKGSDATEGYLNTNLHGSYLHLHWGHHPGIAKRFVQQCKAFHSNKKLNSLCP